MNNNSQRMEYKSNSGRWNGNGRGNGRGNGQARGFSGRKPSQDEEIRSRNIRKPSESGLELLNYEFGQNSNLVN